MDEQTAQAKPIDKYLRKYATAKSTAFLFLHGIFWRTLWLTRLARPYSKFMCRNNWYRKFPDGRCMYCGEVK